MLLPTLNLKCTIRLLDYIGLYIWQCEYDFFSIQNITLLFNQQGSKSLKTGIKLDCVGGERGGLKNEKTAMYYLLM